MLDKLSDWLSRYAASLGPSGIFLIALGDSAFVPFPQGVDALVIAQTIAAPSTAFLAAGLAVLGSVLGSLILYSLARQGGEIMLRKKASAQGTEKMRRQIEEYGAFVLIPPTLIPLPLPMKLFVIAAGVFRLKRAHFVGAIFFARFIRYFGEALLALKYGRQTTDVLKDHALLGLGVAVAVIVLFFVVHRWSTRRVSEGSG